MAQNNNVNSNQNQNNDVVNNAPTNSQNTDNQNSSRRNDAKDLTSGLGGIFSGRPSTRGGNNRFMESALPRNNDSSNSGSAKSPSSPPKRPSARDNINNAKQRYNQAKKNANNPYKMKKGHENEKMHASANDSSKDNFKKKNALQRGMDKAKVASAGLGVAKSYAEGAGEALQNVAHPVEYAKQKVKVVVARKVVAIVGSLFAGCMPFLLIALVLFILIITASSLGAGLFDDDSDNSSNAGGSGVCSYKVDNKEVSNVKVQLLNCEGNTPVEGEDLIDFETYITGVVYQETGDSDYEALKVQAVAARSFALTRPKQMGGGFGTKLEQKNGQWVLSLRSCVNDQVFCNPDKGCWSDCTGGQTSGKSTWSKCTVHSGEDKSKKWSRASLSNDSKVRQAVKETEGEVLLDKNGKIVVTDFNDSNQQRWNKLAKEGKDYYEILINDYGSQNAAKVDASCSSADSNVDSNIDSADVEKLTNLSQSEAWSLLIGKSTSEEHPEIGRDQMSKFTTEVKVPIRTWKSGNGHNPATDTEKREVTITVNKGLASLWQAFFNDLYNNAQDFVIKSMDGCYVYKRTGSTLSAHAYGAACDINADTVGNRLSDHSYSKSQWQALPETRAKYEVVYKGSSAVKIAHKYTLINGSDWRSSKDAMHFSYIRDYSRKSAIECKGKTTCPW